MILDATFRRAADRETAREMAETLGAQWRLIECCLPADLTRRRLEQRVARGEGLSDATWETTVRVASVATSSGAKNRSAFSA
ncbi:MAG: AAA family ATPase [Gammaproteobacteria bacterium]